MAISKDKYIEIAENDTITITVIFDAMSIKERMEAVLYMLDNYDNCHHPMVKKFLADSNNLYLRSLKEANKPSNFQQKREDEKHLTQEERDIILIDESVAIYKVKAGITKEPQKKWSELGFVEGLNPNKTPKIITVEDKQNFYHLLTKK